MDMDTDKVQAAAAHPVTLGLVGSLFALRSAPGATWLERIVNVLCGTVMAAVFGPAMAEYFGLHSANLSAATAFAVGMFGVNIMDTAVRWIKELKLADLLPWRK